MIALLVSLLLVTAQPEHCPEPYIYHEFDGGWVCIYQGDGSYSWAIVPEIDVVEGWNLIGSEAPSFPEGVAFASGCEKVHIALFREGRWLIWNSSAEIGNDDFMVHPGDAYWLHCTLNSGG